MEKELIDKDILLEVATLAAQIAIKKLG